MFCFLLIFIKSRLYSFNNDELPGKTILSKWFDVEEGFLNMNLSFVECKGSCHLELIAFPNDIKKDLFNYSKVFEPECCPDGDKSCFSGKLRLNHNDNVIYKIFQIEGEPDSDQIPAKSQNFNSYKEKYPNSVDLSKNRSIYSVVLANCKSSSIRMNGIVTIASKNGFLDMRLKPFMVMSFIFAAFAHASPVLWVAYHYQRRPKLDLNHILFLISFGFFTFYSLFLFLYFLMWNLFGSPSLLFLLLTSVLRALAIAGVLYVSLVGLQFPLEVDWTLFASAVVILSISSYSEISGLSSFSSRSNGKWFFGFGYIPFFDFVSISLLSATTFMFSIRSAPEETKEDSKRKMFLQLCIGSFITYFAVSFIVGLLSLRNNNVGSYITDSLGFILSSLYNSSLLIINSWLWMKFNPLGWETINDNQSLNDDNNDLGLIDNDPVKIEYVGPAGGSGSIPDVPIKVIDKKKKKSDDGFSIDDDFSSQDLEIESKKD